MREKIASFVIPVKCLKKSYSLRFIEYGVYCGLVFKLGHVPKWPHRHNFYCFLDGKNYNHFTA